MIGILAPHLDADRRSSVLTMVGSEVAGREFVQKMARHLPMSSTGLIVSDGNVQREHAELLRLAQNEGGNYATSAVIGINAVPDLIAQSHFSALHALDIPRWCQAAYLRDRFAAQVIPITGLVYGLSYQFALWDYFARLLLSPALECDAIICPSSVAQTAFCNILDQVADGLSTQGLAIKRNKLRLLDK